MLAPPPPGVWRTSFNYGGTLVHNEHDAQEGAQHLLHIQDLTATEATAVVAYGLLRNLGLEWITPVRHVTTRIQFTDLQRRPIDSPEGDIHHRDETLVGPGDPWLLAAGGATRGPWSFAARAGVSVPLGRTEENPFELGRRGLPHEHIQFGTGSWDPLVGVGMARKLGSVTASLHTMARLPVSTNEHGYRAGRRYTVSLAGDRVISGPWRGVAGLDLLREEAETWNGIIEEEGNLGRTDLLVSGALLRNLARVGTVSLTAKVPLVTRARSAQLDYPVVLSLGWSR